MTCTHDLIVVGEDTRGFVQWCQKCGAIVDSDGIVQLPLSAK